MKTLPWLGVIGVVHWAAWPASAGPMVPRPAEQDPTRIVTPHIAWGKPLAGGPIRLLAIVRAGGCREVYELAQRLDIQFDLVTLAHGHQWEPDDPSTEGSPRRLPELIAQKPHVFLIGTINPSTLPIELHYEILKQVSEGAGLVCVNAQPWEGLGPATAKLQSRPLGWFADLLPALPYAMFTRVMPTGLKSFRVYTMGQVVTDYYEVPWHPGSEGTGYAVGQGRVAHIHGHNYLGPWLGIQPTVLPATETPAERPTMPEYLYAMMAKAVRWAARREPAVRLTGFRQEGAILPAMHGDWKWQVAAVNDGPTWQGTLRTVVRNRWGDVVEANEEAVTLPSGRRLIAPRLRSQRLAAGQYTIDTWLVDADRKIVDWGAAAVTSQSASRVDIRLAKPWFEPTEPIQARVQAFDLADKVEHQIAAQVRDSDGRVLARQRYPLAAQATAAQVEFSIGRPNGIVYYLEAWLESLQQKQPWPIAYAMAKFTVPRRQRDEYYVSANDDRQMTHLSWLRTRMSQQYGVDCQRDYGVGSIGVVATAYYGQSPAPFFSHVGGCGFLGVPQRCLSEPGYRQQLFDGLKYLAEQLKPFGAACYNLGDDTGIGESLCKQPGCFERFVAAMKKKYARVDALNGVWGTSLKSFDEITLDFIGKEQTARNYGPWLDYLYWHEDLYVETFRRCNEIVQGVDPHAWVGQDASGYANVIDLYMEGCTYVAPYFRPVEAKMMGCFRSRPGFYGACTGTYTGDGPNPQTMAIPWDLVFAGNNAILFWSMTCGGTGDLTLHPRGYQMEAIRELKAGIANLFIRAQRQDDGIVLYHSRASKHATGIENRIGYQDLSESSFQTIVEDLGLQARWTTTARAEQGEIGRLKPKVVILPYAQALSDRECAVLRAFVQEGGTLLADARPAVFTYHCRPRPTGGLDDVFGIRRQPKPDYTAQGDLVLTEPLGPLAAGAAITASIVDQSVVPVGARPLARLAGGPAVLVHRFGQGQAVLLNFFVGRYASLLDAGQADGLRQLFRTLLEQAGVRRTIAATTAGKEAPGVELVRFQLGPVTLLGVAKRSFSTEQYPVTVDLKLPARHHVYDLRAGRYLGHTDTITSACERLGRRAFALLPYPVNGLKLNAAPEKEIQAGDVLRLTAVLETPGPAAGHLVRFEAVDPAGRPALWFRDKVWTQQGTATVAWPLALNEAAGRWTCRATDVLSGSSAQVSVVVRAPR